MTGAIEGGGTSATGEGTGAIEGGGTEGWGCGSGGCAVDCEIASRGEDCIAGRGGTEPRPTAEGWEPRLGRGGPDGTPGRGGTCDGDRDIEFGAALDAFDSLFGGSSGLTGAVAGPGGFDGDRPAPSSNIAAIRAAFVGEAGSADAEGAGGIEDPPFLSRTAGFDRDVGLDTGVPSGARRTT